MLIAAGYLPAGFSTTNPFRQTWQFQTLQPTPGTLQTLVTSQGGNAITDTKQLVQIAAQGRGGFVPYANQGGDATMNTNTAYGAFGYFKLPLTNYTNPGSGHIASLLAFTSAQTNGNYLYRVNVGQPALNAMQTDLSMTDVAGTPHNVTGANLISTQSLQALQNGSLSVPSVTLANGAVVAFNQVGEGGVLGLKGSNGQAIWLESVNGAFRLVDSAWQHQIFTVDQVGNVSAMTSVSAPTVTGTTVNGTTVNANTLNLNAGSNNCSWNTVTVRGNNQMFVCNQYGNWVPISYMIGNVYTYQKFIGYTDGMGIGKPPCTGGTPTATIVPQTTGVNVAANPPWETTIYKLVDQGTWWYVQITLIDTNGAGYSGNNLGLSAEVDTQCTFSNT
jgi:hypothetical protein